MEPLTQRLRDVPAQAAARRLAGDILALADREGILPTLAAKAPVALPPLCAALEAEIGYRLTGESRRRMVVLLLELLEACGWAREVAGRWHWLGEPSAIPGAGSEAISPDGQMEFFRRCLEAVPAYLRGAAPAVVFAEPDVAIWDRFLGCEEFQTCRALLLELMRLENDSRIRLLDLCHGPGWGLQAVQARFPAVQVTALDFTDAFAAVARARAAAPPRSPAIAWVGRERWRGFGDRLPFGDGAFDAVLFSCGEPYVPSALRRDLYGDISRVLGPGGTLGVLTRSRPARPPAGAREWLGLFALAHDFAESVCAGWAGFSTATERIRCFTEAGFEAPQCMLDGSLWVVRKPRGGG
ncbi:MAG TPA: methyltransferase domain-containing protein [Candidatus Sulfotelmatobacter sp.]|nr:methyltransferase domain-containing protein [Candidatus Sulfotelmatobacter sp.]